MGFGIAPFWIKKIVFGFSKTVLPARDGPLYFLGRGKPLQIF
jgi:hypothetical protein